MKLLIYIIAVLFVAIVATLFAIDDPGYVLISRTPWSIELSLVVFVILSVILFLVLTALLYLVARAWMIPRYLKKRQQSRSQTSANENLVKGLLSLAAGDWQEAKEILDSDLLYASHPVINYLGVAIATQHLGQTDKRDENLSKALEHSPENALEISKLRTRLQHQAKQYEQELVLLSELREKDKNNLSILKNLIEVHKSLNDWPKLATLLPEIKKLGVLAKDEYATLELDVHTELLNLSLPSGSLKILEQVWSSTPSSVKKHPRAIAIYSQKLIGQKEYDQAEKLLRTSLEHAWDDALVGIYSLTNTTTPENQLMNAEQWLTDKPDNRALLLATGRLAARAGDLDKALSYLEQANSVSADTETFLEIARVLEQQGKTGRALESYRLGLDNSQQTQHQVEQA